MTSDGVGSGAGVAYQVTLRDATWMKLVKVWDNIGWVWIGAGSRILGSAGAPTLNQNIILKKGVDKIFSL